MTSCLISSMKPDLVEGAMDAPEERRPFLGVDRPECVWLAKAGVGGARGFSEISFISLEGASGFFSASPLPALK